MRTWTVDLPSYTSPPLTLNQRLHWAKRQPIARVLADVVGWQIRAGLLPKFNPPVELALHWRPATKRSRDADNPIPTWKVCCDVFVRAGLLPDDTHDVVTPRVVIHPAAKPAKLWLEITEVTE